MKRCIAAPAAILLLAFGLAAAPRKPKLIVAIVIDQFRYDYLTRFRAEYKSGFARLLDRGAVFTDAHYVHYPTVTAIGHSTFLTGATPSVSGIAGNDWFDQETGKRVTSVSDPSVQLAGVPPKEGSSPRRLLVSGIGDEMKMANPAAKVIGISIKDRSAILPSSHMADGAYWFDEGTGLFVSSTYYFAELPQWAKDFDAGHPADRFAGMEWLPADAKPGAKAFVKMSAAPDAKYYRSIEPTPFGNDLVEAFAERAMSAEQLGRHGPADLLTISFSSNDYVGHTYGPDSPQVHDISVRTDRLLGKLFAFLDAQVGADQYLVVLTADHGVSPTPQVNQARKMPGGSVGRSMILKTAADALSRKYGPGAWVLGSSALEVYLNHRLIREKNIELREAEEVAAAALRGVAHISRVYTASQIRAGQMQRDPVSQAISYGYYDGRSGDLLIVPENYWMLAEDDPIYVTTHGTPFEYDNHVPLIFLGPGIAPGKYHRQVKINDVAPTLASILEIETPSGAMGQVLDELWAGPAH